MALARAPSIMKVGDVLAFSSLSFAARSMMQIVEIEAWAGRVNATVHMLVDTPTSYFAFF